MHGRQKKSDGDLKIEAIPPNQANGLAWIMLLLPTFVILGLIYFMMRRARDQFDGGILGSFVKSPAKRHDKSKQRTTFDEVAGLENAKSELQEIVEFLKNPEKFQRLGGRIPKGVLLIGPPGSGKTLLARAVAGEAGVPFFSISGSEFIQMFVGVGASRVRDMFKTAKENSPCILFIDEIDAVGRVRGAGLGGGHDEREQTLNQILTEMDGFSPTESVIVLAATNRPDVLDPALLRPGRFDRHVTVDRPTRKGRLEILKVHTRNVPLAADVDLDKIARSTVGMSGADLANLVNEAALLATRENKSAVDIQGPRRGARQGHPGGQARGRDHRRRTSGSTAYHEVGHALVAWLTAKSDPVHKVTIIPRGRALGVTQYLPEEDRISYNESQILAKLDSILGGRAAERLVFDDLSAGAADDLKQATRLARLMVTQWGMSDRVGPVFFRASEEHPVPRPRDGRAARPLRAHRAGDRRGGRPGSSARPTTGPTACSREHRDDLERIDRGPDRTRGPHRGRDRGARRQARDRRPRIRRTSGLGRTRSSPRSTTRPEAARDHPTDRSPDGRRTSARRPRPPPSPEEIEPCPSSAVTPPTRRPWSVPGWSSPTTLCPPLDHLPRAGELVAVDDLVLNIGGGAANTAVDLGPAGCPGGDLRRVGDDIFGRFATETLRAPGRRLLGAEVDPTAGDQPDPDRQRPGPGSPVHPRRRRQPRASSPPTSTPSSPSHPACSTSAIS